jgi:hypothetical protein
MGGMETSRGGMNSAIFGKIAGGEAEQKAG